MLLLVIIIAYSGVSVNYYYYYYCVSVKSRIWRANPVPVFAELTAAAGASLGAGPMLWWGIAKE